MHMMQRLQYSWHTNNPFPILCCYISHQQIYLNIFLIVLDNPNSPSFHVSAHIPHDISYQRQFFSDQSLQQKVKHKMHFLKVPTTPQVRQNAQMMVQRRQRSPLIQREHHYDQSDPTGNHYHIRVHSQIYSQPVSQGNPPYRAQQPHPSPPLTSSKYERSPLNNPQTPKSKLLLQHKQDGAYQKVVSRKFTKNTQSSLIFRNNSPLQNNLQVRDPIEPQALASPSKIFEKYRKGSCHEGVNLFSRNPPRKQSSNEETLTTSQHTNTHKSPKNAWDQINNFKLSSNNSDQNYKADLTQSQIEFPKSNANRKHSDNFHAKKIPSFLTNSKVFRKSFDNNLTKTKNLSIQNFLIAKQLGKGTFGRVVLAVEKKSKMVCAIKIMSKRQIVQSNMMDQVVRQIKIQMFINHPNVVKVYGFFDDLLHFYIIMESALDGHLSDFLSKRTNPLKEEQASVLLYQTCSAISSLHTHSIIHRDLKPENLMMHQGIIKLSDFGWSVNRGSTLRTTFCGTPLYLCPQILIGDEYDQSVDIWTIGVILYQMLYKSNPFKITCQEELINILNSPIMFDEQVSIGEAAREVIRGCLQKKAADRPNIRELLLSEFVLKGQAADQFKK